MSDGNREKNSCGRHLKNAEVSENTNDIGKGRGEFIFTKVFGGEKSINDFMQCYYENLREDLSDESFISQFIFNLAL
jgi:hypothetical protein